MGKRDPRVDAYIAKSASFARPILVHLRRVVHAGCPEVEETLKWSSPHFMYKGMLGGMAAFKSHCAFGFWKGALLVGKAGGIARRDEAAMGQFGRITSVADLPVHRALHTVWGGGAAGLLVGSSLWAIARTRAAGLSPSARVEVERAPAALGGLIGGVSHALLDGLMHRDVHALRPLAETQWVLDPRGIVALHVGCLVAGALGAVGLFVRGRRS